MAKQSGNTNITGLGGASMPMYQGGGGLDFTNLYNNVLGTLVRNQERIDKQNQARQKQQQETLKSANEVMGKVNPSGLQDVDIPDYEKMYGGLKEKYQAVITNGYKPTDVMALEQSKNELMSFVAKSKQRGQSDSQAWNTVQGKFGDFDTKGVTDYFKQRRQTPTSQLDSLDPEYSRFVVLGDVAKATSDLEANVKRIMDSGDVPSIPTTSRVNLGGSDYRLDTTTVQQIPDDLGMTMVDQLYQGNQNFKHVIDRVYGGDTTAFYEDNKALFSKRAVKSETKSDRPLVSVSVDNRTMTPAEQISTRPLQVGKFSSPSSITRNEKGVLLSGNKEFFDPNTGQKMKVGRDNFQVDYTQDVRLGVDKNGNPVDENSPQAVGTQNFAVAQMVDPTVSSVQANIPEYARIGKKTVLIPEGDRQLFGESKTVKTDATRRSEQNTTSKQTKEKLSW